MKSPINICTYSLLITLMMLTACNGQKTSEERTAPTKTNHPNFVELPSPQISEYIRNIIQDKNGHLWMGTNGSGIAHYNGDSVSYYSNAEGFSGKQVTGIAEDRDNNLWFATDQGVVKYAWTKDGGPKVFTNYTDNQTFSNHQFWSIYADQKGGIWAGSVNNIYHFDGRVWAPFELPFPQEVSGSFISPATSWSITQDKADNMWFSTNGFGAYKFDGQSFTQYTTEDGLTDDSVDHIMEDTKGNMWFGTRYGGVSRFDGRSFINYTAKDSIANDEVCVIYEDQNGNVWMSSEGYGVYRYDGISFANYGENEGLGVKAVQTVYQDREGTIWVGGGGGLYRFEEDSFINVKKNGPWK